MRNDEGVVPYVCGVGVLCLPVYTNVTFRWRGGMETAPYVVYRYVTERSTAFPTHDLKVLFRKCREQCWLFRFQCKTARSRPCPTVGFNVV